MHCDIFMYTSGFVDEVMWADNWSGACDANTASTTQNDSPGGGSGPGVKCEYGRIRRCRQEGDAEASS